MSLINMKFKWLYPKTYKYKCPDGTTKIVYRNIDDAFPLFIPGWEGKVKNNVKAIESISVSMDADYATKIQGLLYDLNEFNQSLVMNFRTIYAYFQSDPCSNNNFFQRQIEKIVDEQHKLTNLNVQIQGLIHLVELNPNNPEQFLQIYCQIIDQIGGKSPEVTSLEIAENRKNVNLWIGRAT